ncbi:MAG TPA: hypothetical protein VJH04_02960 [archaeon]|nr:hypothetical protein [archaeon]
MQQQLFGTGEGQFFERMLTYRNELDNDARTHNGHYRSTLLKGYAFARNACEDGHPKGWYHLKDMTAFAQNIGLVPRQRNQASNEPSQLLLFYSEPNNSIRFI